MAFTISEINIKNCIIAHSTIENGLSPSAGTYDTSTPYDYSSMSEFDAPFRHNLRSGADAYIAGTLSNINIERRVVGETDWVVLQNVIDDGESATPFVFTAYDPFAGNGKEYEYRLAIYDDSGSLLVAYSTLVTSVFCHAYIVDGERAYTLDNEYTLESAQHNQFSTLYQPFGASKPFVGYNATLQYDQATTSAVLIAPTVGTSSYIDRLAQVRLRKEFNEWLSNASPKILKDFNGNIWIIAVVDTINIDYYKELGNGLNSVAFSWVEVGEFTTESFREIGLLNTLHIIHSS